MTKWLLIAGGLLLVSTVPAQAQIGGSIGHVSFPNITNCPPTQFAATVSSGTAQDFVPTTYAPYDQALAQGRTAAAVAAPKSLGEVAQEYSHEAKPQAKLAFEQNEYGQAMVTRR
jgi:hypothetical protein